VEEARVAVVDVAEVAAVVVELVDTSGLVVSPQPARNRAR
jgi:hypothetical protein